MLPSIGSDSNKQAGKLDASGSFLSRMLGRSPSKGSLSAPAAASGGQIQAQHPAMSSKCSAGVLGSTQPPGGSLKSSISSSALSSGWSIGSKQEAHKTPARVPSAKNLQEAAGRASSPLAVAPRVPSAHRLNPLGSPQRNASSPLPSDASSAISPTKLQGTSPDMDPDISNMSGEELVQLTMSLRKEKAALQHQIEAISSTGKPSSKGGAAAGPVPPADAPASESPRKSGVSFAPAHRNSVLVVDFQRPSIVTHPSDAMNPRESYRAADFGANLPEEEDEISFDETPSPTGKTGKSVAGKTAASLENGPSLDPIQAQRAAVEAAAEAKGQLKLSQSMKAAETEARKQAEAKKQAEAAAAAAAAAASAAAAAAAAAGPAKPVSQRRYKLLSLFPLLPPAMRRHEWSLSQFAVEKRLHKGYASEVYKAHDIQSGELMAVKVYNLPALGELNKVQLIREIRLHGNCAHRNIIELYVAFQEDSRVVLAQKYADGGDLLKALHHAGGRLTEHSAVSMVIQPLLSCMVYLHSKNIIHRDIKPENILFDEGVLKVADFGLALNMNEENAVTRAGTLHYMAPEVVKNPLKDHPDDFKNETRYHYNVVVDSWAIGCLAYELLAGYPPFTAQTQQQVTHNINNMHVQYGKKMSEDAIDFMKGALERSPHDRSTTTELIKHPWVQQHMRRGSQRNLTLQPQAAGGIKMGIDFTAGHVKAKQLDAQRAADHGRPKEAVMAPF